MDGERQEGARRASPRVLLVDDDATTRNLVAHFLRKEGFVVVMARDGADALAQARGGRPDLVVVDAAVPGMDGFELLARLQQDPATADLPVLMLSSLDDEEAIVRSLDAGAEHVVMPFSPRILVAKVKKILREARGHAVDRRPL